MAGGQEAPLSSTVVVLSVAILMQLNGKAKLVHKALFRRTAAAII